jgi:hypothetical protein
MGLLRVPAKDCDEQRAALRGVDSTYRTCTAMPQQRHLLVQTAGLGPNTANRQGATLSARWPVRARATARPSSRAPRGSRHGSGLCRADRPRSGGPARPPKSQLGPAARPGPGQRAVADPALQGPIGQGLL